MSYSRNRLLFISRLVVGGVFLLLCSIFLSVGSLKAYADDPSSSTSTTNCGSSADSSSSDDTSTPSSQQTTLDGNVNTATSENSSTGTATVTDTSDPTSANNDDTSTNDTANSATNDADDNQSTTSTCDPDQTTDSSSNTSDDQCPTDQSSDSDSTNDDPGSTSTVDDNTGATIDGCSQQNSSSGQATVETTGSGGSSTSGNSDSSLNEVNEISTTDNTGSSTTQPVVFTDNVSGNQTGNIVIDPDDVAGEQSTGDSQSDTTNTNSTTSVNTDASINNNDSVTADSGAASDSNDGSGGTATSGNAEALANVVNIIDSMITDGQSFIGTVNIYGNFDGNILIPEQLVDELLAEPTTSDSSSNASNSATADITNNVELTAVSGDALVANNGNNGTATSGNATDDIYTINDVDYTIDASNLFLIIVNVSGQWYGYVLGVTPQSNIIILAGGLLSQQITQSTPSIDATSNESITNNIDLTAETGNATVETTGDGGTATSGNAEAVANIINIIDDDFDISNWFGVLFINVFGNWDGSIETYNADPPTTPPISYSLATDPESIVATDQADPPPLSGYWTFVPVTTYQTISLISYRTITVPVKTYKTVVTHFAAAQSADPKRHLDYWYIALSFIPIVLLIAGERFAKSRKSRS